MINRKPVVTILLPTLRIDQFFEIAIQSILNQTFQNYQVLVIADHNCDLSELLAIDSRVFHLKVSPSLNLSQKLNLGIEASDSKYIARMDADDVAHPKRIQSQVDFLEINPEVDIIGTGIRFIGSIPNHRNSHGEIALLPKENYDLLTHMLYKNPFFHPTVMIRAQTLNKFNLRYDEKYLRSQDYELWSRAAGKLVFYNLQEPLLDYRLHESQAGVVGSVDSNYFSSLAKLKYCLTSILRFNSRSVIAFRLLPFRLKQFYGNWRERRREKGFV